MGPTNRRRDLKRGRKGHMKALPPEPPRPVPIPVEISAVIGACFSDQSGNGLSHPSGDAYLAICSPSPQRERMLKDRTLAVAGVCKRAARHSPSHLTCKTPCTSQWVYLRFCAS